MSCKNLQLADEFAAEYDNSVLKNNWIGPEVIFKLTQHQLKPNSKILDLGIGTGESSRLFKNAGNCITGIDGSVKMLEECKKKKIADKLILHNLENTLLPFEKNSFDAVISNGVFHLISSLKQIFIETKRVLKDEGLFSFTYENAYELSAYKKRSPGIWEMKTESGVHIYKYTKTYISELLQQTGMVLLQQKRFLAYKNLELKKDFYFIAVLAKSL